MSRTAYSFVGESREGVRRPSSMSHRSLFWSLSYGQRRRMFAVDHTLRAQATGGDGIGAPSPPGGIVGVFHGFRAVLKVDGVIRRPAHGATRRPPVERPGSGFGRPVRPGPPAHLRTADACAQMRAWDP